MRTIAFLLACVYCSFALGQSDTAIEYYNRAISFEDDSKYEKAIAEYTKAIRFDPNFNLAFNNGGIGQTKGEVTRAKQVRTTKIKIAFLQCDIERYYTILGVYPKTLEGLGKPPDDAASREKWEAAGSPGIVEILPDPWGRRIQYELATKDSYRVWSMGPDGRNNTEDDIVGGADNSNKPSARRLEIATAKKQVQMLAYFVESYATDVGTLPISFGPLKTPPNDKKLASRWKGPYMKIEIDTDPWGHQYDYMVGPDNAFVIFSYGPNGASENGGGDDISSNELIFPRAN